MSFTLSAHSSQNKYLPEENPFQTLMVNIAHQCNANCENCYRPKCEAQELDLDWLSSILARLPRRTRIRIGSAGATNYDDLPEVITRIRELGHTPLLLTNGLKIANHSYLKTLRQAGLRTVCLSFNGGFSDQMYQAIDNLACANLKRRALENLIAENMCISLSMLLVREMNEPQFRNVFHYAKTVRQIRELKVRSVGLLGRYADTAPFLLEEMIQLFSRISGVEAAWIQSQRSHPAEVAFQVAQLRIQLTQWSDLGSHSQGRLTADGKLQPLENLLAHEGGY